MNTLAAHRRSSLLRSNLRLCTVEGMFAMPMVYLNNFQGNPFVLMVLTGYFHFGEGRIGLIAALPALFNVVQIVLMNALALWWSPKGITIAFAWVNYAAWIALAVAIPFLPAADQARSYAALLVFFSIISLGNAMMSVGWTSWVQEWLPERIRGKYFGIRNRLLQLSTLAFLSLIFLLTLWLEHQRDNRMQLWVFIWLSIGAAFLRTFSLISLHRILSKEQMQRPRSVADEIFAQLRLIWGSRPLLLMLGFSAAWGLTTAVVGPFFNVFMMDVVQIPKSEVILFGVVATLTGAMSMPGWGRLIDRFGNKPIMIVSLVVWMLPSVSWCLVTHDRYRFLYGLFALGGVCGAGFLLGQFGLLLKLVPPEAKTAAISLNAAVTALMAFTGSVLGGQLFEFAWSLGWPKLEVYQVATVAHHLVILATALLLWKIAEPKSAALHQVVGAMRSARQIAALLGISFFTNYFFFARKSDEERS